MVQTAMILSWILANYQLFFNDEACLCHKIRILPFFVSLQSKQCLIDIIVKLIVVMFQNYHAV